MGGPPNSLRTIVLTVRVYCGEGTRVNITQGKGTGEAQGVPKQPPLGSSPWGHRIGSLAPMCDSTHWALPTGGLPPWCPVFTGPWGLLASSPSQGGGDAVWPKAPV